MSRDRKKSRPETVGSILESVLQQTGLDQRAGERSLLEDWPEVAGERVAAHVRAVDIDDGVLVLDADHTAWQQELTLLFPELLRSLRTRFGAEAVREIRWLHQRRSRGGYRR
jgi:predicted nucleic acid-binding Zn ribbon protein